MSDAHEEHESFIKTPQQLAAVVVLSFVVFVGVAVLVAQYVLSGYKGLDTANPEIIVAGIQPVARVELGEADSAAAGPKTGVQVYKAACAACHDAGAAGAPKLGDNAGWASRIATGLEAMVYSAVNGKGAMPAKGGNAALTEAEITRAVAYMANESGGNFAEPKAEDAAPAAAAPAAAAPAPTPIEVPAIAAPAYDDAPVVAAAPAAAPAAAGVDGLAVYNKACAACHAMGVAGAPKYGDKGQWSARLATGLDSMVSNAIKGKGAMPAKGGNVTLKDAEVKAAVEVMVAAVK
ncbi:cytochrome c5 family protein [Methyloversatilis sp.]|uniref:c-type cytochrome n=1 Tax=Methyloversatilis sp. TaxID=2569862 RepID=UPI002733327E|nr:c-type cytochrome [Methyloversatilis sp.]MDP2867255.1 c-type cytochrome [Methyloversatilis sp.]MDP3457048.1 c-type cytochrome [Methyloversatilis sp.]